MMIIQKKFSLFFSLPLLTALLLAPASAAPAPTPTPTQDRQPSHNEPKQSLRQAVVACQKGTVSVQDQQTWGKVLSLKVPWAEDLLYAGCQNAVSPQEKSCDALRGSAPDADSQSRRMDCLDLANFTTFTWRALKTRESSLCEKSLAWPWRKADDSQFSPEAAAVMCRGTLDAFKSGQNRPFCEQGVAKGILPKALVASCINHSIELRGRPELCASVPDYKVNQDGLNDDGKVICRERAALVAALRSDQADACAASPLCSALSGRKTTGCASFARAASKTFCGQVAKLNDDETRKESAAQSPDAQTLALQAKTAKEQEAAKEAALKKAAAEMVQHKLIVEERKRREEALRQKKAPPRQFRHGEKLQVIPPDVKKRMDEINKKSKAARPAQPTAPETPEPKSPTP